MCHKLGIFLNIKVSQDKLFLRFIDTDNGMDLNYEVKPCWSCSELMTPTLTQTLFVVLIIVILLWIGLAMILSIGQNKILQNANDPDLHIKTDT